MLRISSTPALIGVHHQWASLRVEQAPADMHVEATSPSIDIQPGQTYIDVDNRPPHDDIGLKRSDTLRRFLGDKGRHQAHQGVARIVSEGHRLADIHLGGNAIAQVAAQRNQSEPQMGYGRIPKQRPRINLKGDPRLVIDSLPAFVGVHSMMNWAWIHAKRHKVDIHLRQQPTLEITHVDNRVDFVT